MDGYGEFFWNDGKKYYGFYKEDKRDGFGIYYQSDKILYIGFWKGGKKYGFGKYIKGKRIKYGIWKNGEKEKLFESEEEFFVNLANNKSKCINIFKMDIDNIMKILGIE